MTKQTQLKNSFTSLHSIGYALETINIPPKLLADFWEVQRIISEAHTTVINVESAFNALIQLFGHAMNDALNVLEIEHLLKPHFNLLSNASDALGEIL